VGGNNCLWEFVFTAAASQPAMPCTQPVWATNRSKPFAVGSCTSFLRFTRRCRIGKRCGAESRGCHASWPGAEPSLLVGVNIHLVALPCQINKPSPIYRSQRTTINALPPKLPPVLPIFGTKAGRLGNNHIQLLSWHCSADDTLRVQYPIMYRINIKPDERKVSHSERY
jgi:hypothetical protein